MVGYITVFRCTLTRVYLIILRFCMILSGNCNKLVFHYYYGFYAPVFMLTNFEVGFS